MKKSLYPRLAWPGIKKNGKIYFPYLAACMAMVAVFYVLGFLSHDKIVRDMNGGDVYKRQGPDCGAFKEIAEGNGAFPSLDMP